MCYPNPGDARRERRRRRAGFPAAAAAAAAAAVTVLFFPVVSRAHPHPSPPSTCCFGVPSTPVTSQRRTHTYAQTHVFNTRNILHSATSSDDVGGSGVGDGTDGDGLTAQERILRQAGLSPETPEERAERLQRRTEAENKLKAEKRTNVVVAVLAFLAAFLNYGWKLTHPITPVAVLAEMQSQSAPLDVIGRNGRPTVVDFWAPWCENCKMAAPTLQAIEKEYDGKVNFIMVNADQGSAWPLVERFGVDAIPHLAMISAEGDVETALIGPIPRGVLRADLDVLLDNAAARSGKRSCDRESVLVPASSSAADSTTSTTGNAAAMASSTMAMAGGRVGGTEGMKLPYDVPAAGSASSAAAVAVASPACDTKKDLPYVMLDAFRNRPDSDRRVTF